MSQEEEKIESPSRNFKSFTALAQKRQTSLGNVFSVKSKKLRKNTDDSRLPPTFKHSNFLIQASQSFLNIDSIAKFEIDESEKNELLSSAPNYED